MTSGSAPGPTLEAYADFTDPDDPALAALAGTRWCVEVIAVEGGRTRVQLDATALAAQVKVVGWLSPSRSPGRDLGLAPTLGGAAAQADDPGDDPAAAEEPARAAVGPPGIWCLVANVAEHQEYGEAREVRLGTPHFSPNTKVYCFPPLWGDGYKDIQVIGRHRGAQRLCILIMPSHRLTNWRAKFVRHPFVLNAMGEGWDRDNVESIVAYRQLWEAARRIRRGGYDAASPEAALVVAAMYDDADGITRALERGAPIDTRWEGWTALTAASQWAWPPAVQLLLSRGAAVDVPNDGGETPAMIARGRQYPDMNALLTVAPALGLMGWLRRWWLALAREP